MNTAIIELHRDLLLNELMEVENQLENEGIKRNKKGYTIFTRNGVYYVKYTDSLTGKQIPTNRCLYTNNKEEADILAKKYRKSFLKSYYDKKNRIQDLSKFFSEYYDFKKSVYLKEVIKRKQRKIGEKQISEKSKKMKKFYAVLFLNKSRTREGFET